MDLTASVTDINLTVTPPPSMAISVTPTTISLPITGVGGMKGDKGDTGDPGAPGTTDYTQLTNVPTTFTPEAHTHTEADITNLQSYATQSALTTGLATKANSIHTHAIADVSDLQTQLSGKQATLVSGTSIKTINGTSLLGSGDIAIAGGEGVGVHTHAAADVTDFDTEVSNNTDVAANTAARHTHSNQATLDATTASFTTAKDTKLTGIATGATANDTDANLKNRANHTGTQLASTISDFSTAADARVATKITNKITVSTTAPSSPATGDLWVDTN